MYFAFYANRYDEKQKKIEKTLSIRFCREKMFFFSTYMILFVKSQFEWINFVVAKNNFQIIDFEFTINGKIERNSHCYDASLDVALLKYGGQVMFRWHKNVFKSR